MLKLRQKISDVRYKVRNGSRCEWACEPPTKQLVFAEYPIRYRGYQNSGKGMRRLGFST